MKSLQHVFWRGALALGLMAVGVGSGVGMPPAAVPGNAEVADCPRHTRIVIVRGGQPEMPGGEMARAFVVSRGAGPATPES